MKYITTAWLIPVVLSGCQSVPLYDHQEAVQIVDGRRCYTHSLTESRYYLCPPVTVTYKGRDIVMDLYTDGRVEDIVYLRCLKDKSCESIAYTEKAAQ